MQKVGVQTTPTPVGSFILYNRVKEKAREYFEKEKNFQERSNGDFSESTKRKKP